MLSYLTHLLSSLINAVKEYVINFSILLYEPCEIKTSLLSTAEKSLKSTSCDDESEFASKTNIPCSSKCSHIQNDSETKEVNAHKYF